MTLLRLFVELYTDKHETYYLMFDEHQSRLYRYESKESLIDHLMHGDMGGHILGYDKLSQLKSQSVPFPQWVSIQHLGSHRSTVKITKYVAEKANKIIGANYYSY
jgi:predicted Zn-dependent protease